MKLKDKVAIVVGGGSGIGRASATLMAQEGAKVMIADLVIENANKVANNIKAAGGEVSTIKVDMTKEEEVNGMVRVTLEKYGKIDILANVAGGSMGPNIRDSLGPFAESTKEMWDRIIDINLNGARNCTRAVINHMMERGSGKIVCFSSIAGVQGLRNGADYSAAKAGIIGFTKALAQEMSPYGIQVNCVAPSGVYSERMQAFATRPRGGGEQQEQKPGFGPGMDISRFALPEEVAGMVLFLVSDDSNHMSGQTITITGAGN